MCSKKSALAWKIVNEFSGRNNSNRAKYKANSGKERIQLWNDHFKEPFGKPSIPTSNNESILTIQNELDIKKRHFTIDELKIATKSINNGKAVDLDEIPAQVWKI